MMGTMRKKYGVDQKVRVALEAIRGDKTLSEISSRFGVHSNQVSRWKRQALSGLPGIFSGAVGKSADAKDKLIEDLYCEIGKLKVETEFLKKSLEYSC